ncbi:MAG: ornithine cyclodeaminase family protein [Candidatus Dormibacteraceae bacterium]
MTDLLYLSRADVERLLDREALSAALERALIELSAGRASAPPRVAAAAPAGIVSAMAGHVPGPGLGVKLVSVFPRNHGRGLPTHQGLIALFEEETGTPFSVMDGLHITALRTGATAALAALVLARAGARILTILGAGVQGASHLDAVARIRDFSEIRVASRDPQKALRLAGRHPLGLVATSFEEAVRGADVVCCCTHSAVPIIDRGWLAPGAHVSSVGSGAELDASTVAGGRVFVEWRGAVTSPPPAGAQELQGLDPALVTEVGEVLAGTRPGRTSEDELTVYKSTGHAVEDLAAARLVHDRAVAEGIGVRLHL